MKEEKMLLAGKNALVTGAGRGIGRAIARALAREGARVTVADLDADAASAVAREITEAGGQAFSWQVDLTRRSDVERMARGVAERVGPLDILVNNAGWDHPEAFLKSEEDTWNRIIDLNFRALLYTNKAFLPGMIERPAERGQAKVVNISSDAGRGGSLGQAGYSGTKGAVIAFSKTMAREMARHKINVNVVCPGLTDTKLFSDCQEALPKVMDAVVRAIPWGRVGQPEEVAEAVVYLASPGADYVTGQTLSVSGGLTMM